MSSLKTGIAYFVRNRDPKRVEQDMLDIKARGCTYVVHFMTEFDTVFFPESVKEICQITRDIGLEVYLDPWGLGGFICSKYSLFPLDHPSECQIRSDGTLLMQACPNSEVFAKHVERWLDKAAEAHSQYIFWDEPHLFFENSTDGTEPQWACRCTRCQGQFADRYGYPMPVEATPDVYEFRQETLYRFFHRVTTMAHHRGLKNSLCLLPLRSDEHGFSDWDRFCSLPHVDIFGTDPYWYFVDAEPKQYVTPYTEKVLELCQKHQKEPHIWLQGFRVPKSKENEIAIAGLTVYELGIRNIAVWVDKYGTGDNNASGDPEKVWSTTGDLYRFLHTLGK